MPIIQKIILSIIALALSAALIVSIPMLNFIIHGPSKKNKEKIIQDITIKKTLIKKARPKPKRKIRKPTRKRPSRTRLKTGPRFAMDLSVAGGEGVEVEMALVNKSRGQGGESGDVDERPSPENTPPFSLPPQVRDSEINALTIIAFCVDESGRAFDMQIAEETPAGLGMGAAGKEALRQTRFKPAVKDGMPVSFCGLEQPFEVKFDD